MVLQFYGLDNLTICFFILTQCQTVTNGRTDKRIDISTTAKTAVCNASRGKKTGTRFNKSITRSFWAFVDISVSYRIALC